MMLYQAQHHAIKFGNENHWNMKCIMDKAGRRSNKVESFLADLRSMWGCIDTILARSALKNGVGLYGQLP